MVLRCHAVIHNSRIRPKWQPINQVNRLDLHTNFRLRYKISDTKLSEVLPSWRDICYICFLQMSMEFSLKKRRLLRRTRLAINAS